MLTLPTFSIVRAQNEQSTTQQDITEGDAPPIGEEQDPNPPVNNSNSEEIIEDRNQTFLNGVLAGVLVGLVVGGIISWLFKDKFYKK